MLAWYASYCCVVMFVGVMLYHIVSLVIVWFVLDSVEVDWSDESGEANQSESIRIDPTDEWGEIQLNTISRSNV